MIFSNLINGGVHAATNLAIQEYIAVAKPVGTPAEMVARIIALYREVGRCFAASDRIEASAVGR